MISMALKQAQQVQLDKNGRESSKRGELV